MVEDMSLLDQRILMNKKHKLYVCMSPGTRRMLHCRFQNSKVGKALACWRTERVQVCLDSGHQGEKPNEEIGKVSRSQICRTYRSLKTGSHASLLSRKCHHPINAQRRSFWLQCGEKIGGGQEWKV